MPRSHRTMSRLPRCGDVLRRHQPLLDRRRHAALEHDRLAGRRRPPAAARSWPCCGCRPGACPRTTRPGPRRRRPSTSVTIGMPGLGAHVGEDAQAGLAQPLERVRRRARLEGTAAQERGPGGLGHLRRLERLLRGLDRARPGDEREGVRPDRHRVLGWSDPDGGHVRMVLACHQLVRRADPHHVADAGQTGEVEAAERRRRPRPARRWCRVTPRLTNASPPGPLHLGDDARDVLGGRVRRHHDDHDLLLTWTKAPGSPGARSGGGYVRRSRVGGPPGSPGRKAIEVPAAAHASRIGRVSPSVAPFHHVDEPQTMPNRIVLPCGALVPPAGLCE